jgi:hypothetical protein
MRIETTFMKCVSQMDQYSEWQLHSVVELYNSYISPNLRRYARKIPTKLTRLFQEHSTLYRLDSLFVLNQPQGEGKAIFITYVNPLKHWKIRKTPLGTLDWKLWFFPWWQHPDYVLDSKNVLISKEMSEYFEALESKDIFLNPEQKAWYVKKMLTQGEYMKREYPSTPEEAFETANEGYYFAKMISVARQERRICHLPYDENAKTYTAWDIGIGDSCAIWVFQLVGKEVHCIDYYENSDEALAHYVKWLKSKPYIFEKHFLPHDAASREKGSGKSFADIARGLGLKVDILPRDTNEMFGIECLRSMLPRFFLTRLNARKE